MPSGKRLDMVMVERGLTESREKAQRLILAGKVRVKGETAHKASVKVKEEETVEVEEGEKFVSRGGFKLEAGLEGFKVECSGRVCLDVGASTGGFCDCLLQRGAKRVYAVDVGGNLIAWKLRNDSRVVVIEKTNARYLSPSAIGEPVSLVTADVSFISLTKVLPAAKSCAAPDADFVVLIKPQFEAGRDKVEKGGVVRDPAVRAAVVERIRQFAETELKAAWLGVLPSPILGPAGNQEYLAHIRLKT
ncbi:MAG: TlyA family RNA methyltransferase [Verrucomicrobiae bacterium]|nr:TlyA family RNA methyltransferase [Verrucomicrobiae bacterium]